MLYSAEQSTVLPTCLTSLKAPNKDLRGSGEQQPQQLNLPGSFDVGHYGQGGKTSQVFQFPVSAGSYLPEKSQAKDSAISFPTQGSVREESSGSPLPLLCSHTELWISLFSPARQCTIEW